MREHSSTLREMTLQKAECAHAPANGLASLPAAGFQTKRGSENDSVSPESEDHSLYASLNQRSQALPMLSASTETGPMSFREAG